MQKKGKIYILLLHYYIMETKNTEIKNKSLRAGENSKPKSRGMKTAHRESYVELWVTCPYCHAELSDATNMTTDEMEQEIVKCPECGKKFRMKLYVIG